MKISELVQELLSIARSHGDCNVIVNGDGDLLRVKFKSNDGVFLVDLQGKIANILEAEVIPTSASNNQK